MQIPHQTCRSCASMEHADISKHADSEQNQYAAEARICRTAIAHYAAAPRLALP